MPPLIYPAQGVPVAFARGSINIAEDEPGRAGFLAQVRYRKSDVGCGAALAWAGSCGCALP